MLLTELNPRWCIDTDVIVVCGGPPVHDEDRHGMALTFDCPCCLGTERSTRLAIFFANPVDGKPPSDDANHLWERTGTTFEDLTLSPSIDASGYKHWHGFIEGGRAHGGGIP